MKVVVTGTPGTGKTTALDALDTDRRVVHLNDAIRDNDLWTERDEERDTLVTDLDGVREWLGDWDGIVESHLAHRLDAEKIIVLRCRPDVLDERLRERGESETKARENSETAEPSPALTRKVRENRESEALDVVLSEAVEFHGEENVYEIDTTDRTPEEVTAEIRAILDGEREPSAGTVDFIEYL